MPTSIALIKTVGDATNVPARYVRQISWLDQSVPKKRLWPI